MKINCYYCFGCIIRLETEENERADGKTLDYKRQNDY